MQNELHIQINMALSVMVLQGEQICRYFADGKVDQAFELLKEREFSFHNFRYADLALLKMGIDVADDKILKGSVEKLIAINRELEKYCGSEMKRQGASLNALKFSAPAFKDSEMRQVKKFNFNIGI